MPILKEGGRLTEKGEVPVSRPGFLEKNLSLYLSFCSDSKKYLS